MAVEQVKALDVEMINNVATINIHGVDVFDLTWDNTVSDEKLSAVFFSGQGKNRVSGSILYGKNELCINLPKWQEDEKTGERFGLPLTGVSKIRGSTPAGITLRFPAGGFLCLAECSLRYSQCHCSGFQWSAWLSSTTLCFSHAPRSSG